MLLTPANLPAYVTRRGLLRHVTGCEALAGGVACGVWKITGDHGRAIVLKQAHAIFRVREHWRVDRDRNWLEAAVQQRARAALGPAHVPAVLDVDRENFCYAMESAPAAAQSWKSLLLAGQITPALGRHCRQLLDRFHQLNPTELPAEVAAPRFFYQQRIEPYFEFTARRHPLVAQLIPELQQPAAVTHGDYSPKNLLVTGAHIIILDYEVTHLGQPAFDVATLVNHLTLKMVHLPAHRAELCATLRAFLDDRPVDARLVGALQLARVDGKSPVEYLTAPEQQHVRELGTNLLRAPRQFPAEDFVTIVTKFFATKS
jgi:tRNA A-37 threonylcarbamoyl transferase component Bud32